MSGSIDSVNSSLYFSVMANAANNAKDTQKSEKGRIEKKKSVFSSMIQKSAEVNELISAGLPPEIAGLSTEDAFVFLMDAIDISGDTLSESATAENFAHFRKSVSQFLKFLERNNYETSKIKRYGREYVHKGPFRSPYFAERKERPDPWVQVRIVNEELDKFAREFLEGHADKIQMLARVNEIKGLLVDFFAA
ncbi:MAG: YaaR family protein [Treponema sp.]|nr:YaaR family protein [Treponema sp.]